MSGDSETATTLASRLERHLRRRGDDVVVVAPDAELEVVGEEIVIATHGVSDAKKIGHIALAVAARFFTRSRLGGRRPK
jgi:broad specificity polyphosphatase/5'/3'-nucleotidase SurE